MTTFLNCIRQRKGAYAIANLKFYLNRREHRIPPFDGALITAYFDNKRFLWELIRLGVPVDEEDFAGGTVLITAAGLGDFSSVRRLISL